MCFNLDATIGKDVICSKSTYAQIDGSTERIDKNSKYKVLRSDNERVYLLEPLFDREVNISKHNFTMCFIVKVTHLYSCGITE